MIPALLKATALTVACLVFCSRHIDAFNESDDNFVGDNPAVWGPRSYDKFASHESDDSEDLAFFEGRSYGVWSWQNFSKGRLVQDDIMFRNGVVKKSKVWPSPVIPVKSYYGDEFSKKLFGYLRKLEKRSCLKIVNYSGEKDHIAISNIGKPAFAEFGHQRGEQLINIATVASQKEGGFLHLFMHALGFWHEHIREDRDEYVRVVWENIDPSDRDYFEKHVSEAYGLPYDYGSVMHAGQYDFALDKKLRSIVPVQESKSIQQAMGQRKGLSDIDFAKLNAMFRCKQPRRGSYNNSSAN